ncbi:MAG: alpha/beta fold hydrolase [Ruthenibacterium sp.]
MTLQRKEVTYQSKDGKSTIFARIWEDDAVKPEFVVQICHGMCEYIDRYDEFAEYVCSRGGVVCGNDHLGHGNTKQANEPSWYGYFADKNGEKIVVEDIHTFTELMKQRYKSLPFVLMGHSMGSMLARSYMTKYSDEAVCAIFMGTSGSNNLTGIIRFLANVGMFFGRAKKPATFLSHLAFSKYNDRYKDVQTKNDWITRDRKRVEKYNADAQCTFLFTDRAAYDFANLVDEVSGVAWAKKLPKDKPYLLVSGSMDPVGNFGDGVREVYGWMKQAGDNVEMKLYEGARHELLNEINRDEVKDDLFAWIKEKIK